jgi:hypothetical protein
MQDCDLCFSSLAEIEMQDYARTSFGREIEAQDYARTGIDVYLGERASSLRNGRGQWSIAQTVMLR